MSQISATPAPSPLRRGIAIAAVLSLANMLGTFFRSSNAVIAPELIRELAFTPEMLGTMTSVLFITVALVQLPYGIILDRFGPRRIIVSQLFLAIGGAVLFSVGHSLAVLTAGQALLGLGTTGIFMGAVVLVSRWFPADRLALGMAVIMGMSNFGNLMAATPLAFAVDLFGWRNVYLSIAVIVVAIMGLVLAVVRDAPPDHAWHSRSRESWRAAVRGLAEVLTNRSFLLLLPIPYILYSSGMAVRGLWGGPFLQDVFGLDTVARGNVLMIFAIVGMFGPMLFGPMDRWFNSRRLVALGGGIVSVAALALLATVGGYAVWSTSLLFGLFALGGSFFTVVMAQARNLLPDRLTGRAMTALNAAGFLGSAITQALTGALVGAFTPAGEPTPEIGYLVMFGYLAVVFAIGLAIYARAPDTRPRDDGSHAND
ncbi:MAG: MFS transporter [Alphaproteobacteria bacterium]